MLNKNYNYDDDIYGIDWSDNWDADFKILSKKIHLKTRWQSSLKEMGELVTDLPLWDKRVITALHELSNLIWYTKFPAEPVIEQIINGIRYHKDCLPESKRFNDAYIKSMEDRVEKFTEEYEYCVSDANDWVKGFLQPFYKISQACLSPYHGRYIRISETIGNHGKSVLVSPKRPQNALVQMYDDNIRSVFHEYGETESAESVILSKYSNNQEYLQHYSTLLDCKSIYPIQSHLL